MKDKTKCTLEIVIFSIRITGYLSDKYLHIMPLVVHRWRVQVWNFVWLHNQFCLRSEWMGIWNRPHVLDIPLVADLPVCVSRTLWVSLRYIPSSADSCVWLYLAAGMSPICDVDLGYWCVFAISQSNGVNICIQWIYSHIKCICNAYLWNTKVQYFKMTAGCQIIVDEKIGK